ncbi:MAG: SDR family oxidoreductase [Ktedonobacterales bacterium]
MRQSLADKVVVITGASSGVGRATALEFARKGARVVVSARRAMLLDEVARECERVGAPRALAVPADVTDEWAVVALAQRAIDTFGRIDVWVNNAAVVAFGPLEDVPLADHLRVLQTNLIGMIYGARAALPIFKLQGSGVLINVGSLESKLSEPYMSAYAAAKHGVAGLGMALRQELLVERAKNIHVCTVMPQTIDTPLFQHAANYSGRAVKAMPPVLSAERVARAYVRLAERPRREVFVGNAARQFWLQYILAPGLTERMFALLADRLQLSTDQAAPPSDGNLYQPMMEGAGISGGWKTATGKQRTERSWASRIPLVGSLSALAVLVSGLLMANALRQR